MSDTCTITNRSEELTIQIGNTTIVYNPADPNCLSVEALVMQVAEAAGLKVWCIDRSGPPTQIQPVQESRLSEEHWKMSDKELFEEFKGTVHGWSFSTKDVVQDKYNKGFEIRELIKDPELNRLASKTLNTMLLALDLKWS